MRSWRYEARIEAPPDAVYAWMSDFREDDHARPAFLEGSGAKPDGRVSRREVLSRSGNRVELRDTWGKETFPMTVELVPEKRELRLTGQYGYRGAWRAEPDGAGTRVVSEGALEPSGVMRLFAPLFAGMMRKQMGADFRGHVADMRSELTR